MLHGRALEISQIDQLLAHTQSTGAHTLVLRGEAGIGKTALLDYAQQHADDFLVLRCIGVETENQWSYSGLHMLLRPVVKDIETMTLPQLPALRSALGMNGDLTHDHFQVGVAVLNLLAELAERQPVLCVVDDAQWLDQETQDAVLFAARRFTAEPIAILVAAREGNGPHFMSPGLAEMYVGPINEVDSRSLLADTSQFTDEDVISRLIVEAQGNPLALHELSVAHREGRVDDSVYPAKARSTANRLRHSFAERIVALPAPTQDLLLLASAGRNEEMAPILAAANAKGATVADLSPAEEAGLLRRVDDRITFSHPLIRAAAYWDVPLHRRIDAHRRLADISGQPLNDRVFHLSWAATGPDESLANMFVELAEAEDKRGSHSNRAMMYECAAKFTADVPVRSQHLLAAAESAQLAGKIEKAIDFVEVAQPNLSSHGDLGRCDVVRAKAQEWSGDHPAAHMSWLSAAEHMVADRDPNAGYPIFRAVEAAWSAGLLECADKAASYATAEKLRTAHWVQLLADGIAGLSFRRGRTPADAVRDMRSLIEVHEQEKSTNVETWATAVWLLLLCSDLDGAHASAKALAEECRRQVGLAILPQALCTLARVAVYKCQFAEAVALISEAQTLQSDMGHTSTFTYSAAWVRGYIAAIRGDEEACRSLLGDQDPAKAHSWLESFLALIEVGNGRYREADQRLKELMEHAEPIEKMAVVPDAIEASVRVGDPDRYREVFAWYADYSEATEQAGSLALMNRCRALLSEDDEADQYFSHAVKQHRQGGDMPFERSRTDLLYGEWLRRQRRNSDARSRLRAALEEFERLGARTWAARAASELRAAGESTGQRETAPNNRQTLTAQELQVSQLAADGLTNREIGQQLFLSPRTVGYHLYKAYPKLGVTSRSELGKLDLACYAIGSCV